MQNIPSHVLQQIRQAICRPEGTFTFQYHSPDLFNATVKGGVLFEIPSGQHLFRLERDDALLLHFYHSSPGTGTRVATIDLRTVSPASKVFLALTWTPEQISLHIGPQIPGGTLASATGAESARQFRIGRDNCIYQVGDKSVQVMGVSVYRANQPVLLATAKEAWDETIKAVEAIGDGESSQSQLFRVAIANLSIVILVVGFESYSKRRFVELEQEGISPNTEAIINVFFPSKRRNDGVAAELESEARSAGISVLQRIVDLRTINFQSYRDCKRAFNKAYGIKFGDLPVPHTILEQLQSYIRYRHRIIHISPLLGMLNQDRVPPEEPVFSNKQTSTNARNCFSEFIESLHRATLTLRPNK